MTKVVCNVCGVEGHETCARETLKSLAVGFRKEVRANAEDCAALADACEGYRGALWHALAYLQASPHGENCYLSDNYDGDPGNQCNCGKESIVLHLAGTLRSKGVASSFSEETKQNGLGVVSEAVVSNC
jgi:hypothetical protein